MTWFRKKPDPISDRARALTAEIAAIESKIKRLDSQLQQNPSHPRLRSTALPQRAVFGHAPETVARPAPTPEPVFEDVAPNRLKARGEVAGAEHYNDLGVRKYDLPALLSRLRNQFRGPSTTNPKLVNYLAAGGVQGLRPMRYEKRVARNRLLALVLVVFVILFGVLMVFLRNNR